MLGNWQALEEPLAELVLRKYRLFELHPRHKSYLYEKEMKEAISDGLC